MIVSNQNQSTEQKSSNSVISAFPFSDSQGNLVPGVSFLESMERFGQILDETGRFYFNGKEVYFLEESKLIPLSRFGLLTPQAMPLISRYVHGVGRKGEKGGNLVHFPLHKKFLQSAINHPATRGMLPQLKKVTYHPYLDIRGELIEEGYHSDLMVLVIDPIQNSQEEEQIVWDPNKGFRENLPYTMDLLDEFLFRTPEDKLRFLSFLLALPMHLWLKGQPRPILEIQGNQPNLGKTLLAKVVGILAEGTEPVSLDGVTPQALAREHQRLIELSFSKVRLLDNLRGKIDNTWLERIVSSPTHQHFSTMRQDFVRTRNDFIWILTANDLELTPDLENRILRVELYHPGSPMDLVFQRDPLAFARKFRGKIFRELSSLCQTKLAANLALVQRKTTLPPEPTSHRCRLWANLVRQIFEGVGISCPSLATKEFPNRPASPEFLFQKLIQRLWIKHPGLFQEYPSQERFSLAPSGKTFRASHPAGLETWEMANALEGSDLPFFSLEQRETPTKLCVAMGRFLAKFHGIPFVVCPSDGTPMKASLQINRGGKNIARYRFHVELLVSQIPDWKPGSPHPLFPQPSGRPMDSNPIMVIRHEEWIRLELCALGNPASGNSEVEKPASPVVETSIKSKVIHTTSFVEKPGGLNSGIDDFLLELNGIHAEQRIAEAKELEREGDDLFLENDSQKDQAPPNLGSTDQSEGPPAGASSDSSPDPTKQNARFEDVKKLEDELLEAVARSEQASQRWEKKPPGSLWEAFFREDPTQEKLHAILGDFCIFTDWIFDVYICSRFLPRHMYCRFLKFNDFDKQKFIVENTKFKFGKNLFVGFHYSVLCKLHNYHELRQNDNDFKYHNELIYDFYPIRNPGTGEFRRPSWVPYTYENESFQIKKVLLYRLEENERTMRRYLKWAKTTKSPILKGVKWIGATKQEIERIK